MKIIFATGQTYNQYFIYTSYIADAIEKKETLYIWLPCVELLECPNIIDDNYVKLITLQPFITKGRYIRHYYFLRKILGNKIVLSILSNLINLIPNLSFNSCSVGEYKSKLRLKHEKLLFSLFRPNSCVYKRVNDYFKYILSIPNSKIIGVHIRRGDYRTVNEGRFFFEFYQYASFLKRLAIVTNYKLYFVIVSNETIPLDLFSDKNIFNFNTKNVVEDNLILSKCDYIVGPPSTFSAWASIVGNTPIYFIENIEDFIDLDSFEDVKKLWGWN